DRPAPGDGDRAAVVPRLTVRGEAAGQDRDDRERDGEVGEMTPGALQFLVVSELLEAPRVVVQACYPGVVGFRHRCSLRRSTGVIGPAVSLPSGDLTASA